MFIYFVTIFINKMLNSIKILYKTNYFNLDLFNKQKSKQNPIIEFLSRCWIKFENYLKQKQNKKQQKKKSSKKYFFSLENQHFPTRKTKMEISASLKTVAASSTDKSMSPLSMKPHEDTTSSSSSSSSSSLLSNDHAENQQLFSDTGKSRQLFSSKNSPVHHHHGHLTNTSLLLAANSFKLPNSTSTSPSSSTSSSSSSSSLQNSSSNQNLASSGKDSSSESSFSYSNSQYCNPYQSYSSQQQQPLNDFGQQNMLQMPSQQQQQQQQPQYTDVNSTTTAYHTLFPGFSSNPTGFDPKYAPLIYSNTYVSNGVTGGASSASSSSSSSSSSTSSSSQNDYYPVDTATAAAAAAAIAAAAAVNQQNQQQQHHQQQQQQHNSGAFLRYMRPANVKPENVCCWIDPDTKQLCNRVFYRMDEIGTQFEHHIQKSGGIKKRAPKNLIFTEFSQLSGDLRLFISFFLLKMQKKFA